MIQTASLSATYSGPNVPENLWWVRLEQIPVTTDVATVGETGDFLDALYQVDPCTELEPAEEDAEITTEDVAAAASETLTLAACDIASDGSCEVQIKVIRSHQTEPYRLHVAGGSVVETVVVNEEIDPNIAVSGATEHTLDYPVMGAFTASWQSDLITASGKKPAIKRHGNVLYWDESATGTLRASYLTVYDLLTIKVDGVAGEPGDALIRVVFHALAEEMTPELPEPAEMDRSLCNGTGRLITTKDRVTCYKAITVHRLCSCSKEEVGNYSYDQIVDCPDWVIKCLGGAPDCMALLGSESVDEYVEFAGDNQVSGTSRIWKVSSPDYYKKICCEDPKIDLPQCYEKTTSYRGGKGIVHGPQFWRDLYGPLTQFRPVSPAGGICGKHITRQVVRPKVCCDGVAPMAWDTEVSPAVQAPNSAVIIGVTGGRPPYTWTVDGTGFQFQNGSKKIVTTSPTVLLSALALACGGAHIRVDDGCSTVTGSILSTAGRWVLIYSGEGGYPGSPPVIAPGTTARPAFTDHWREGIVGGVKVRQKFAAGCLCYAQCYAQRATYAEALSFCAANSAMTACSTLVDWAAAGYFLGSLFDDPSRCSACGECGEMPDYTYFSYKLGAHSQVYWSTGLRRWVSNLGHVAIIFTEVYEWQC